MVQLVYLYMRHDDATKYGFNFAVLGGEVAVPCTRNPL